MIVANVFMIAVIYVAVAFHGLGSALGEKRKKIGVGKKRRRKAGPFPLPRSPLYFSYFTPFFAFFPNCGVWFQASVAAGFVAHNC